MPARWVELALRIDATLDDADQDLNASERQMFLDKAYQFIVTRRAQPPFPVYSHPIPTSTASDYRDPSGE